MDPSASANCTLLGKSPPSPVKTPQDVTDFRKAVGNRRRTTSNSRHRYTANRQVAIVALVRILRLFSLCVHRRDTFNEDNHRSPEVLHFSGSTFGELLVHRGKVLGETYSSWPRQCKTWPR